MTQRYEVSKCCCKNEMWATQGSHKPVCKKEKQTQNLQSATK